LIWKRSIFWVLTSILFGFEINYLSAQDFNFRIDEITTEQGLSNYTSRCIVQDSLGFLWFGTESGLNRFDGYYLKVYLNSPLDSNSISKNMIHDLYCDSNGDLWLGITNGGLNKYEQEHERFIRLDENKDDTKNYSISKGTIAEDSNKQLWVGYSYNGLLKIDLTSGETTAYQHNPKVKESLSSNRIKSVCVDNDGLVWIGTRDGVINVFDPELEVFTKLRINDSVKQKPDQDVAWKIFEDSYGILWISTENALYTYDKKNRKFIKILKSEENKDHVIYGFITGIFEDEYGNLWAGGDNGLYVIYRNENKVVNLFRHSDFESIFKDKSIVSLYKDESGIIWAGMLGQGIYKIDPTIKAFKTKKPEVNNPNSLPSGIIRTIYTDKEDNLWVGNLQNGISVFSGNEKIAHFKTNNHNNTGLTNDVVTSITQDDNGYYWIATDGGGINIIKNFDKNKPEATQFDYFRNNLYDNSSLRSDNISSIYNDYEGNIWVGMSKGLDLYNEREKSFIHVEINKYDDNLLSDIQTNCILKDRTGAMWIGSWHGVVRFEYTITKNSVKVHNYQYFEHRAKYKNTISDNRITALYEDNLGDIWIGTYGGGLNRLSYGSNTQNDFNKYIFENYTKIHGLASDEILGIQADMQNNLWISTNNGLSKFDVNNKTFKNYDISDGLLGKAFFWGASHKAINGEIFFGTTKGLNEFFPDSIKPNDFVPKIVFTGLKIDSKIVESCDYSFSNKQLNFAQELLIPYSIETFTVEFASLHYSSPDKNKYKYKLEPYNKKWIETDAFHRFATYTNLDPGTYVLKIMATNNDGIWNENPLEINITILSPYWKTIWFKTIIILLSIILIYIAYRLRINSIKRQSKNLEMLVNSKTIELKNKTDEILVQNEEMKAQNELVVSQRDKILNQNKELNQHRNHLEKLVIKRTEDLRKEKENVELADKLKTSFLENISHEIRTPLNAIVGFSNLFQQFGGLNKEQLACVENINRGSKSLISIIESILQVSRLHAGEQKLEMSEFYLSNLLEQLYEDAINSIDFQSKPNLKLEFELDTELKHRPIVSDQTVLEGVLQQLIDNAIKYTEEGRIRFGAYADNNNLLRFYVEDTGIGIDDEAIKHIFDRFRKIESDKTKLYRGLGIGLSIAKSMVTLLDGQIWCKSVPNKGSIFYFTCPIETVKKNKGDTLIQQPYKIDTNLHGKKILIAEDEELNYHFLEMMLRKTDAKIIWAKDGGEVIDLYAKNQDVDLILMDIKMPILNGIEALKKIRENNTGKVPIIAQTAYGLANEREKILSSGFDAYIEKPIDINKLIELIIEHI